MLAWVSRWEVLAGQCVSTEFVLGEGETKKGLLQPTSWGIWHMLEKMATGDCPEISEQAGGAFGRLLEEVSRDKVGSGTDEVSGFGDVF